MWGGEEAASKERNRFCCGSEGRREMGLGRESGLIIQVLVCDTQVWGRFFHGLIEAIVGFEAQE